MIKNTENFENSPKRTKIQCICDYFEKSFERTKNNIERSYKHLKNLKSSVFLGQNSTLFDFVFTLFDFA